MTSSESPTQRNQPSILLVEDDPEHVRAYGKALRDYRLTSVTSASAALDLLGRELPDLIILDNILEGGERGIEFLPKLKAIAAHVPIIVISGTLHIREQLQALQGPLSAHYTLEKPVGLEDLERTVEAALANCGFGETVASLRSLERAEKIESNQPERLFTERLARQHELTLRLRRSHEKPNISALAREFGVARKTIHRDLQDLVARRQIDPQVLEAESG